MKRAGLVGVVLIAAFVTMESLTADPAHALPTVHRFLAFTQRLREL
jgi:hypothetical protein